MSFKAVQIYQKSHLSKITFPESVMHAQVVIFAQIHLNNHFKGEEKSKTHYIYIKISTCPHADLKIKYIIML